jgi:two-component system phosphate regulon sensor histidine kinase PhoR
MRRGRFLWKLFIANSVLIAATWASCIAAILWQSERHRDLSALPLPAPSADPATNEPGGAALPQPPAPAAARRLILVTGICGLIASLALGMGMTLLWSRRIAALTAAANALARGDFPRPLEFSGNDEVAALARSMNRMAERTGAQLATLDRRRRMLEAIVGQIDEGVILARGNGRMALINPAARRLLRMAAETTSDMKALSVEECVLQHDLQRLLLSPSAGSSPARETHLELSTTDGPAAVAARVCEIDLPASAAPTPRHGGSPIETGRLLVLTDVSELTRAIRQRTDFVANASHELRTPLSAIRAANETLLNMDLAVDHAAAPRFLDVIARHIARLEALVADLLDLSRIESPGGRFERTTIRLASYFDEVHGRWVEAARRKGVRLEHGIGPDCATVGANPRLLDLVLDNLLDNALKFTPPGGLVRLHAARTEHRVAMTVSDNGCGIAPEEHERVFERFYQVSPSRSPAADAERGTGLGLSIVKHAVAAMSGEVRLESAPGKGATLIVTLPADADAR